MPIMQSDLGNLALAGVKTTFLKAYDTILLQTPDWQRVATIVPSTLDTEKYGWFGQLPQMREFKDERIVKGMVEKDYSLTNKVWEATIGVDRRALESGSLGSVALQVQNLASEYARFKEQKVMRALAAGCATTEAGACYDGLAYFAATHKLGGNTILNYLADVLDIDGLKLAVLTMAAYKGDADSYLGIMPDTLIVPPKLMFMARDLLDPRPSLTSNWELQGTMKTIVSPYLATDHSTNTQCWIVADLSKPLKPILFQEKGGVEFRMLGPESEAGFFKDMYVVGIRAEFAVGYTLPQLAYFGMTA